MLRYTYIDCLVVHIKRKNGGRGGSRESLRDRQAATEQNGGTRPYLKQFLFDLPIFISIFSVRRASNESCIWTKSKQSGKGNFFQFDAN